MTIKKMISTLALITALFLCATADAADVVIRRAEVPFDFVLAGKVMPAGTYSILRTDLSPDLVIVRNVRTGQSVSALGFPEGKKSQKTELLFDTVDGQNVLRAVVTPSSYSTITPSAAARRMAATKADDSTCCR
jgi:hypothetical protein